MPKVRAVSDVQYTANVASISVPLPEHATNDLLLIFVTKDTSTSSGGHSTPSGWTKGGELASSGTNTSTVSHRAAWYYRVATSDNEADPTITNADSDSWTAVAISVEGVYRNTADSDAIDVSNGNGVTDDTGAPFTAASVNTANANSLVFYACTTSTSAPVAYPGVHNLAGVDTSSEGVGVSWTLKKTAGATSTQDFYVDATTQNTVTFTVGLRDGSSGAIIPGYVNRDCATLIHPLRGVNAIITGDTWQTSLTNYPRIGRRDWDYVVQEDVGTGFTDLTSVANSATTADFAPFPTTEATGDYCAFGYYKPFQNIVFDYASGTAGVGGVVTWQYWNGTAWTTLSGVTDGTTGFTVAVANNLQVRWTLPANWKTRTINGSASLYFVRANIGTVYTTNPNLDRSSVSAVQLSYNAGASAADTGVNPFENSFNNISTAATSIYYGRNLTLGSSVDVSGKIIVGTMLYGTPRDHIDKGRMREGGGSAILLADSSHNHKAWLIASYLDKDTAADARNTYAIQWAQSTDTTFGRTLTDPSSTIANVVIASMDPRGASANYWNQLIAVGTYRINGGSSTNPIDTDEFLSMGLSYNINLFPDGVFYVPVTIGGGDAVHVYLNLFSFKFPTLTTHPDFYTATPYTHVHIDPNVLGFFLDARNLDTCKMTNGLISSTNPWKFEILGTASSGATWDFSGLVLVNATVTLRNVTTFTSMTFTNCPVIDISSCIINSCTISGAPAAGAGITVNTSSTVTSCTIDTTSVTAGNSFVATTSPEDINNTDFTGSSTTGHAIRITSNTGSPFALVGNTFTSYGPTVFGFHTTNDVTGSSSDWITKASHGYTTGDPVRYMKQGGTANIGLTDDTTYYVRNLTTSTIAFYATAAEATSDTNRINLTSTGSETHYINSMAAAIFNDSGAAIVLNISGGGTTPSIRNGASASTTVNNTVTLTVTVLDKSDNGPIKLAQVAAYKTSDDSQIMNEDTETVDRAVNPFVVGVKYRIVSVGTTDFTAIGASSNTVGVVFTATGTGSGTGTATNGVATETFNYVSDTPIYVRVRKSLTGETKYVPVSTTGTITSTGFSVTISMSEDTNA